MPRAAVKLPNREPEIVHVSYRNTNHPLPHWPHREDRGTFGSELPLTDSGQTRLAARKYVRPTSGGKAARTSDVSVKANSYGCMNLRIAVGRSFDSCNPCPPLN